jgi:hypothetical protein
LSEPLIRHRYYSSILSHIYEYANQSYLPGTDTPQKQNIPTQKKKKKKSQKKQNKQKTQKLYTLISLKEDLKTEWHNQQKDSCQNLLEKATYFPSYCSIQS